VCGGGGACNQEAGRQMIKINLLPTKKKPPKKVIDLQQQVILAVLVLVLIVMALGYYWKTQNDRIAMLERENAVAEKQIADQNNMLKEVNNVEEERKKVFEKIEIIEKLKKNQAGPVQLLDTVSTALPKGVNVSSLSENNNSVNIEGEAFTNEDVVRFIDNLKASPLLQDVMLLETSQQHRTKSIFTNTSSSLSIKGCDGISYR
jgi:type IV pilus assembly protein PilN